MTTHGPNDRIDRWTAPEPAIPSAAKDSSGIAGAHDRRVAKAFAPSRSGAVSKAIVRPPSLLVCAVRFRLMLALVAATRHGER